MLQPWYVRSQPLQQRTGSQVFQALYGSVPCARERSSPWQALAVLLESPYPLPAGMPQPPNARYSLCAGPPRYHRYQPCVWTPPLGKILAMLSARLETPQPPAVLLDDTGRPWPEPLEPFAGGWLGWLGYDLAWEIETLPAANPDPLPFPVAFWYEPETFAVLDHDRQSLWLASSRPQQLESMTVAIAAPPRVMTAPLPVQPHGLTLGSSQAAYEAAVQAAKRHIAAGDIFQANLSLRFSTSTHADSWHIYRQLQQINPSPFASYWRTPWGDIVSASPERLVSLRGNQAETRPIAGTCARGASTQHDRSLAHALRGNPKERAEHVMLVDLERNDLGRVCVWGSVLVDELMVLEPYSHVIHLVSNITGALAPENSAIDLIRAVFPGGTITGCPKVRCMEIIEALEPVRRSLFYGSCGYLDSRGNLDLNILIRTLLAIPEAAGTQRVVGQVGAGIVADSDPEQEWHESLQKAKAQLLAMGVTPN